MTTRFCSICGTEVDETAAFCPSCGTPLVSVEGERADIPSAPAWPEPDRVAAETPALEATDARSTAAQPPVDEPTVSSSALSGSELEAAVPPEPVAPPEPIASPEPIAPPGRPAEQALPPEWGLPARQDESSGWPAPPAAGPEPDAVPATPAAPRAASEQIELPFTWPVMLSGWLIGVGSLVAALSLLLDFRTFANPVTLIVFLLLLAVSANVFLASNIPQFANRRLWVLVVLVAAFGIALWRVGLGANFAGVVFFLAALAAAGGAIMVELGRDRPMRGPVG